MSDLTRIKAVKEKNISMIKDFGIKGMGIGYKKVGDKTTDELSLILFVEKKLEKKDISLDKLLPAKIEDVTCDVVEIGNVIPLAYDTNIRPIIGGYSVGHYNITAGTIGTIVYRNGKRHVLSNNHVLADTNAATLGDAIYQPGPFDGGTAADTVANLTDYIPLDDYVKVDCAIAEIVNDGIASDVGVWGSGIVNYVTPALGTMVYKSGRTTCESSGVILYTHVSVDVTYSIGTYQIDDCFATAVMSSGGDSGSLGRIDGDTACGLLFAGSASYTIYNYMSNVVNALGITFEYVAPPPPTPPIDLIPTESPDFNYIFYPDVSASASMTITNISTGPITPQLSFVGVEDDPWYETLRISDDITVTNIKEWTGVIAAGATKTLYLYSKCTKEGFSGIYDGSYWANSGFAIADGNLINNEDETVAAIDADTALAGSTLTLNLGVGETKEFTRLKMAVDATDPEVVFDIQYSDDNVTYVTVYTGADTSVCGRRRQITWWWNAAGAHRYWRIKKTNAATAGGNICEVQWLLFDTHDIDTDQIYGDHKAILHDATGFMADYEVRTNVMVAIDTISRQNYTMAIGKIGKHSKKIANNIIKNGNTMQLYYIPTATFSGHINGKADLQVERRVWDIKCMFSSQKRYLQYILNADGLSASQWPYEVRTIWLPPYGPDNVGWYVTNYDFWHSYGHSLYMMYDNRCYKIDDIQPAYYGEELVAMHGRFILQSDMVNLTTDPRNYLLTNRQGNFTQFPVNGYSLANGGLYLDRTTSEQRPIRWIGALPDYIFSKPLNEFNNPTPYSLTGTIADDTYPAGEAMIVEDWTDPEHSNFVTAFEVAFAKRAKAGTLNSLYFQMDRFYNWIGFCDANTSTAMDIVNYVIQLYLDEDCLIPVKLLLDRSGPYTQVENKFATSSISVAGLVTLKALGSSIVVDSHAYPTPKKLYVRYIPEDNHIAYYYP